MDLLETIVDLLASHQQPATYGAVAGVVGRPHRSLMADRPRDARHSWIVNKETRRPTGYDPAQLDPDLPGALERHGLIETPEELDVWIGRLAGLLPASPVNTGVDWLKELIGSCANEPEFERMVDYGRDFREAEFAREDSTA